MSTATSSTNEVLALFEEYVVPNYRRYPLALARGEGAYVWDAAGKRYLDFFPGWGCNLLGHCPPRIVEAVKSQVGELIHVPNTWHIELQGRWAQKLSERSFGGKAFFCNSGAEANEAAIKLARLRTNGQRFKIITFEGGFHGRTLATTAATAQPKYHEGLGPMVAGFAYAPFGDLEAVKRLIDDETGAILVEPIQGEGGVRIAPAGFLEGLRELADEHEVLLIFDEVQTGCGRTGEWFAYQRFGGTPDIMTLAKSICGGVAGAALLTTADLAPSLRPGMHAATFGGNPIAAAAGIAMIESIEEDDLLGRTGQLESQFRDRLAPLVDDLPWVEELRICGLMIGVALSMDGTPIVQACMDRGLLVNCTQETVIRLLPPMILTDEEVDHGCGILGDVLRDYRPQ